MLGLSPEHTGRLNDCSRGEYFSLTLGVLKDLSSSTLRSLIIALLHAKFLVALGFLDNAGKEFQRALLIDRPDDPGIMTSPWPQLNATMNGCLSKENRLLLLSLIILGW